MTDPVQRYYGRPSSHDHSPPRKSSHGPCRGSSHSCVPPSHKKHHCREPERGPRGPPGCDGKDGRKGCDGKDGRDGEDGCDGQDGEDGCDGRDGKDGRKGCDGKDGQDGCDGDDGEDGKDGDPGMDGIDGDTGPEGPKGPSGKAGCKHSTEFVITVSADGHCDFTKLCDALEKAAEIPQTDPAVTIIVFPGEYELCDMKNCKEINVIGKGTSQNAVRVGGEGISWGNKSWTGITFFGKASIEDINIFDGTYVLDSESRTSHLIKPDTFCKCIATDNFQFRVNNNRMKFRNCFFNYFALVRDKVIFIDGGSISICFCKFFICRLATKQEVSTFMCFNTDSTASTSEVIDSHFRIIVDGSDQFYIFNIKNTQFVAFCYLSFNWIKSKPKVCVLFGTNINAELGPTISKGVKILVNGCKSYYNPEGSNGRDQGVIITSDLWTDSSDECITFTDCFFQAAKLVVNATQPAENLIGCWHMVKVTFQSTHPAVSAWESVVFKGYILYITIRFCSFTVQLTDPKIPPIIKIGLDPDGTAATNFLNMEVTHVTFLNTIPLNATKPVWLETEITPAASNKITNGDLLRIEVDPAAGATFTDIPATLGA